MQERWIDKDPTKDPLFILAQIYEKVKALEESQKKQSELIGQLADQVTELRLDQAKEAGTRKGFLGAGRIVEHGITALISIGSTLGVVKGIK